MKRTSRTSRASLATSLLAVLALPGCFGPEFPTLNAGVEAVIYSASGGAVWTHDPATDEYLAKPIDIGTPAGTKVRIVSDTGDAYMPNRDVLILVLEGPEQGYTRAIARKSLRPVP